MPVTEEVRTKTLEKISEYQTQGNKEDAICFAIDILTNDAIDDWTPEQIIRLNDKLKRDAQKSNHLDYPEYEPIRQLFDNLTDREKVLLSLCQVLMFADNHGGNKAGKYLRDFYDDNIYNEFEADCCRKIIKKTDNTELKELAKLAITIEDLSK